MPLTDVTQLRNVAQQAKKLTACPVLVTLQNLRNVLSSLSLLLVALQASWRCPKESFCC